MNVDVSTISHALSGRYATAAGYNWCYVKNYNPETFQTKTKTKKVIQYDLNNVFIQEWKDAKEAAQSLKKDASAIRKVCNGKQKTAYGFIWRYKE